MLAAVSTLSAGCTPSPAVWNQFHADVSGSGAVYAATRPADGTGVLEGQIGPVVHASPVIAPDGRAYISTYQPSATPYGRSELLRLFTAGVPRVEHRFPLEGQATTPAVDAAGNVYVARFTTTQLGSALHGFGEKHWSIAIVPGRALTPPRVLQLPNRTLILVAYTGGRGAGSYLLIADSAGNRLVDHMTCLTVVGGGRPGFRVPGIDLGYPYPETAAVGVWKAPAERGSQLYVVVATDQCGIAFLKLDAGPTPTSIPTLTPIELHDSDDSFAAPAITADGTAIVVDSGKHITAYDVTTGNERWQQETDEFVWGAPALMPLGLNYVFVATSQRLIKIDVSTGQIEGNPAPLIGTVDAAPAAGGNHIFVSTSTNLFTFDLNLKQVASRTFAGGRSSPAIGPYGQLHVASTDGWYRIFPGY